MRKWYIVVAPVNRKWWIRCQVAIDFNIEIIKLILSLYKKYILNVCVLILLVLPRLSGLCIFIDNIAYCYLRITSCTSLIKEDQEEVNMTKSVYYLLTLVSI